MSLGCDSQWGGYRPAAKSTVPPVTSTLLFTAGGWGWGRESWQLPQEANQGEWKPSRAKTHPEVR